MDAICPPTVPGLFWNCPIRSITIPGLTGFRICRSGRSSSSAHYEHRITAIAASIACYRCSSNDIRFMKLGVQLRNSTPDRCRRERSSAGHRQRGAAADGSGEAGAEGSLSSKSQEVAAGFLHAGLGANRLAVAMNGVAAVPKRLKDDAQVIPGRRARRIEKHGSAQMQDCVLHQTLIEKLKRFPMALAGCGRVGRIGMRHRGDPLREGIGGKPEFLEGRRAIPEGFDGTAGRGDGGRQSEAPGWGPGASAVERQEV
jgi:hypothetical protein